MPPYYHNFSVYLRKEDARDVSVRLREFALGFFIDGRLNITDTRDAYIVNLISHRKLTKCGIEKKVRITIKDFNVSEGKN